MNETSDPRENMHQIEKKNSLQKSVLASIPSLRKRKQRNSNPPIDDAGCALPVFSQREDLDYNACLRAEDERAPKPSRSWMIIMFPKLFSNESHEKRMSKQQYSIPPRGDDASLLHGISHVFLMSYREFTMWQLRTSIANFFILKFLQFIILVMLFSFVIILTAFSYRNENKQCISSWDVTDEDQFSGAFSHNFELAFELSWTTLTTVGYGAVSPSISSTRCWGLRFVCAIEAFVGVLFVGFAGAIFFQKIGILLANADVTFSGCLCIQHGTGVGNFKNEEIVGGTSLVSISAELEPYPVLRFRVANNHANEKHWHILDATMTCMIGVFSEKNCVTEGSILKYGSSEDAMNFVPMKRVNYCNVAVKPHHHPFFKRIWYVSHKIDENSPFLKQNVKDMIIEQKCWPSELNTHSLVRSSLVEFTDLLISLKGTSSATCSEVFAEKRYKFEDVRVGWQFATMTYLEHYRKGRKCNRMKVDLSLIHDILPQLGDGNEPIDRTGEKNAQNEFSQV